MWIFFLSLVYFVAPVLCQIKTNCPVTSQFRVSENGYLPFPSLYWPAKLKPEPGEEYYNCSIPVYQKPSIIGTCMPQRPCLISPEIIHAALEPQKWKPSINAICSLEEQIHAHKVEKKHTSPRYSLNLIIIGGSMTKGSGTEGKCVCNHSEHSRCPSIDRAQLGISFCSWATHFVNWLRKEFSMIQFNVIDISHGGMSSNAVPNMLNRDFRGLALSDNDIIIIDESVNDAIRPSMSHLKGEVESMIRRLFMSAKGSYPTIIMIEQFPHGSRYQLENIRRGNYSTQVPPAGEYEIIYRSLSEHYQLPLYSMRDVYWTYFNKNIPKSHRYRFSPYDDWHLFTHPPWYFHNFMADVIADCFLDSLTRCRHNRKSRSSHRYEKQKYILPLPYYSFPPNSDYCDISEPYLLDVHAKNYFHPKNLTEFEQGYRAKQTGWREYVDHRNDTGWIINDLSAPSQRDLSFPIQGLFPNGQSWTGLIVVMYLKSYEGMGAATIFLCGLETPRWIDGLSRNYKTEKISVPSFASVKIDAKYAEMCNKLPADKRTLMIRYRPDFRAIEEVRHHKKVKIFSVQICSKGNHTLPLPLPLPSIESGSRRSKNDQIIT
jgi:hypothetical protein